MNISHFFIDRPVFAAVISIVITLAGALALFALPVAQYPEIAPPTVRVSFSSVRRLIEPDPTSPASVIRTLPTFSLSSPNTEEDAVAPTSIVSLPPTSILRLPLTSRR